MNCSLFHMHVDSYLTGKISGVMKEQIREHLTHCPNCADEYASLLVTHVFIHKEKNVEPDFFLPSRIMSKIEALEERRLIAGFQKIWRPVFLSLAVAGSIFIGVMAGNFYQTAYKDNQIPEELVLINDAGIESLSVFNNQ